MVSQAALGSLYAWSAFVPELYATYGLTATESQLIFAGMILTNTLLMVFAGRLLNRTSPRTLLAGAGSFFAGGYLLARLSNGNFFLLFVGMAILLGCAIGFGYVTLLVTCVRWFPDRQGLATGMAVAGFGGGSIVISAAVDWMLKSDFGVLEIFNWLGIAGGLILLLAALIIRFPGNRSVPEKSTALKFSTITGNRLLWLLFFAMLSGTFAGLVTIGNLRPIADEMELSTTVAIYSIAIFAVGNAGGRLLWGWLADRLGGKTIPADLTLISIGIIGIIFFSHPLTFYFFVLLTGLCFGASFVIYAAFISDLYGPEKLGQIYPFVFLSQGVSGLLGPLSAGVAFDLFGSYQYALFVAALLPLLAAAVFLSCSKKGRFKQSYLGPQFFEEAEQ